MRFNVRIDHDPVAAKQFPNPTVAVFLRHLAGTESGLRCARHLAIEFSTSFAAIAPSNFGLRTEKPCRFDDSFDVPDFATIGQGLSGVGYRGTDQSNQIDPFIGCNGRTECSPARILIRVFV